MAFTDAQKQDIIYYLGHPAKILIETSTHYNSTLASRLENLPEVVEGAVLKLIAKVKKIDDKLMEAIDRFSTKRVDDIELNPDEKNMLRSERSKYLKQVGGMLDIPLGASATGSGVMFPVRV